MSKRQSIKRVDSSAVQGEGSWVDINRLTYGMSIDAAKTMQGVTDIVVLDEYNRSLLVYLVAGWNWVDNNGAPLPTPSVDPTVIDQLYDTEVAFLVQQIAAQADRKNS